jgi:hypothetical protein
MLDVGFKHEDEEFKQAVMNSLENLYTEQSKDKMLNKFFHQVEMWKDKENYCELIEKEISSI